MTISEFFSPQLHTILLETEKVAYIVDFVILSIVIDKFYAVGIRLSFGPASLFQVKRAKPLTCG